MVDDDVYEFFVWLLIEVIEMKEGLEKLDDCSVVWNAAENTDLAFYGERHLQRILTVGIEHEEEVRPRRCESLEVVHLSTHKTVGKGPIGRPQKPSPERRSRHECIRGWCGKALHAHKRSKLQSSAGHRSSGDQVPNCCHQAADTYSIDLDHGLGPY